MVRMLTRNFMKTSQDENYYKLIDIGSCSVHRVHGTFRAGAEQYEWELKKFLKGAFTILQLFEKTVKVLLALPRIL